MTPSALGQLFFEPACENVKGDAVRWIRDKDGSAYCYLCEIVEEIVV